MNKKALSIFFSILILATALSGCISGGGDTDDMETTTAPPTSAPTNAPTTVAPTTSAPTQPPTTAPATPALVHNECSTSYKDLDPGNTRYYDCSISNVPNEQWRTESIILSNITTDYDMVFFIARENGDYKLQSLDVNTGDLLWSKDLPFLRFYELILQDEKLYVFQNGDENVLICYDAHDGSMLWISEDVYALYPDIGDLLVRGMNYSDDKIFVTMGEAGSNTVIFCCFNAKNGEIIWHKQDQYDNHSNNLSIDGGVLYYSIMKFDGDWNTYSKVLGLDIDTGNLVYEYTPPDRYDQLNGRDIVVSNGLIYAMTVDYETYKHCIICISNTSNNIIWSCDIGDNWGDHFIVGDGQVFVNMYEGIICINKVTGQELWNKQMDNHLANLPYATDDKLIVFRSQYQGEISPEIKYLDVNTGVEIWSMVLNGTYLEKGASFYEDKVLVGTDNGYIYCFI